MFHRAIYVSTEEDHLLASNLVLLGSFHNNRLLTRSQVLGWNVHMIHYRVLSKKGRKVEPRLLVALQRFPGYKSNLILYSIPKPVIQPDVQPLEQSPKVSFTV